MLRAVHFFNLKRHTCTGSHPHALCLHIWGQTENHPERKYTREESAQASWGYQQQPQGPGEQSLGV